MLDIANFNINNIISILAVLGSLILSAIILFRGGEKKIHLIYALCGIGIALWISTNLLADLYGTKIDTAFLFSQLAYTPAVILPFLFIYFTILFCQLVIQKRNLLLIAIPTVILLFFTFSKANIKSLTITATGASVITLGWIYWFFIPYFVLYFGAGFLLLYKKRSQSKDIIFRSQVNLIILGVLLTALFAILFDVIFPLIGEQRFVSIGPISSFLFLLFSFYAIIKHHLFNIKVIATEIFTVLMALLLFFNIFFFQNVGQLIFNVTIFVGTLIFGIFLIESVLREVRVREEIQKLASELQKAYEDLKVLDKAKSQFISMASHQLRTPLSAIKGYISMMIEGSYGQVSDKTRDKLSNVFYSTERLIRLVNDLLDISKIEMGRMEVEKKPTQIEELIESCCEEIKIEAGKKNLNLVFKKPKMPLPKIEIDSLKIRQVISNLIDNAIRYTQEGKIEVGLEKVNSNILISVKDTGEGLTREEKRGIFEGFVRGSAGLAYFIEGAGLGLYVAKRFLDLHNGKIWAESKGKGEGSTFYVELPSK